MKRTTWQRISHGRASVSWGQPPYGEPRLVGNAPLDAIEDLITALHMIPKQEPTP